MLTYFEGNELKPVLGDYPDYDHLMNHVAVQLDSNEFQLYRTPVVLTLQGEFEVIYGDILGIIFTFFSNIYSTFSITFTVKENIIYRNKLPKIKRN